MAGRPLRDRATPGNINSVGIRRNRTAEETSRGHSAGWDIIASPKISLTTVGHIRLAIGADSLPDMVTERAVQLSLVARRRLTVKVQIDSGRCQGHGRCYDVAPGLFGEDDGDYGRILGDGLVPPGQDREARLAIASCPERAIAPAEGA